jgi:type IV pilus assembly protein PilW
MALAVTGFSLIELLVSMVIGLVVTLAITSVLIRGEASKRSTTSVNDVNQTGVYSTYLLDRAIRSAGSGFSQSWATTYGCRLNVSQSTPTALNVLPIPSAINSTSAFARVTAATLPIRLAPVVIAKDLANPSASDVRGDVLMVMSGTAGFGESPLTVVPGSVTAGNLRLANTIVFRTGDLVLLTDTAVTTGCMFQQVLFPAATSGSTDQNLPLGGTYYSTTGTNVNLSNFGASTTALQLGSVTGNMPQFQLYGVGSNHTLVSYDLLQANPTSANIDVPIADGVVEMRALYGTDTYPATSTITWVDPSSSGWDAATLMDGTPASQIKLKRIVSIRVGLILRTSLEERAGNATSDAALTYQRASANVRLFSDLGSTLERTRALTGSELNYRYRTFEVTIPLRNVTLAP